MRVFLLGLILVSSSLAEAAMGFELTGFYGTDSFTNSPSESTLARHYFMGGLLAPLDSKSRFYMGFQGVSLSHKTTDGSTTNTYTSMDLGPYFLWAMDEKGTYTLSLGYNVSSEAKFNDGSSNKEWSGTSLFAGIGFMPEVKDDFYMGFKILYYAATYSKQRESGVSTDVSIKRNWIIPTFSFVWRK